MLFFRRNRNQRKTEQEQQLSNPGWPSGVAWSVSSSGTLQGSPASSQSGVYQQQMGTVMPSVPPATPPASPRNVEGRAASEQPKASGSKRCSECGAQISTKDNFCLFCGNRQGSKTSSRKLVKQTTEEGVSGASLRRSGALPTEEKSARNTSPIPARPSVPLTPVHQPERNERVALAGRLVLITKDGTVLQEYSLGKPEITIGRAEECDVVLARDKLTSRHHATVRYENGQYHLYDEQSASGTFLNDERVDRWDSPVLRDGAKVRVGEQSFVFFSFSPTVGGVENIPTVLVDARSINARRSTPSKALAPEPSVPPPPESSVADMPTLIEPLPDLHEARRTIADVPTVIEPLPVIQQIRAAVSRQAQGKERPPHPSLDMIRFTAFHPKIIVTETWNTLLVYPHLASAIETIYADVQKSKNQGDASSSVNKNPGSALPESLSDINLTIVPECEGIVFNPRRVTLKWRDEWHKASFRFFVRKNLANTLGHARVSIFAGPLLISTLQLMMQFERRTFAPIAVEETARLQKRIYAAYSDENTNVGSVCRTIAQKLELDYMLTVDSLRSERNLQEELKRMIAGADVFQLFWSQQAMTSAFMREEWRFALSLGRKEEFLRPIYWETPRVASPEELSSINFTYLPVYTFS